MGSNMLYCLKLIVDISQILAWIEIDFVVMDFLLTT